MPFKSARQERYLRANESALAEQWARKYGSLLKGKSYGRKRKLRKRS